MQAGSARGFSGFLLVEAVASVAAIPTGKDASAARSRVGHVIEQGTRKKREKEDESNGEWHSGLLVSRLEEKTCTGRWVLDGNARQRQKTTFAARSPDI